MRAISKTTFLYGRGKGGGGTPPPKEWSGTKKLQPMAFLKLLNLKFDPNPADTLRAHQTSNTQTGAEQTGNIDIIAFSESMIPRT